jgi:hypothetical protein
MCMVVGPLPWSWEAPEKPSGRPRDDGREAWAWEAATGALLGAPGDCSLEFASILWKCDCSMNAQTN